MTRILVVEDNADLARGVQQVLHGEGFTVALARSAEEGAAEFRALFGLGPAGPFYPHPVNGWAALGDRHRGAAGRYELSRVAYDWTSRTALVFVRLRCGNICENTHYVVLRLRGGEWKVDGSIGVYSNGDDHTYDAHEGHGMRDTVVAGIRQEAVPPAQAPLPVAVPADSTP